ncbi:Mut7-C RNAse domain-containing protein [Halorhabdus rudnickae]|uniref:Mut7-C RNAse domain-containing protein n=1 Tax=Halorhabdus rudnickae TaxID=1775544 RepID=UPI0010825366|nr:Mut7-C RNAse domain-containing protein [Halorhabdus rudnickae]
MRSERFLLDAMLGKLATYLRMCGYDAAYALDRGIEADDRLIAIAQAESRTVVTRDRSLAASAPDSALLESRDVHEQLRELVDAGVDLTPAGTPTRCGRCNGHLEATPVAGSTPAYAPDPDEADIWQCEDCGQYFWKGSHWDDVAQTLSEL